MGQTLEDTHFFDQVFIKKCFLLFCDPGVLPLVDWADFNKPELK